MASEVASRYRILAPLGRGGMGEVFLANDIVLNRQVAIKRILKTTDATALDRLLREARLAGGIQHPNVIAVHDLIVEGEDTYIVMEFFESRSMAELVRAQGRLEPTVVAGIGAQVAAALEAAHRLGIVHRDVKPSNILINDAGVAKLADFGVARGVNDANLTGTGMMIGSIAYMPPEVATGLAASAASDVFSLGATIFGALEGHPPFAVEGEPTSTVRMLTHLVTERAPAAMHAGPLAPLVARMMAPDPKERPTAGEVQRLLAVADVPASRTGHDWPSTGGGDPLPTVVRPAAAARQSQPGTRVDDPPTRLAATTATGPASAASPEPGRGPRPVVWVWAAVAALALVAIGWGVAVTMGGRHDSAATVPSAAAAPLPASSASPGNPPSAEKEPAASGTCWDGQSAAGVTSCSQPEGVTGLRYVFPSLAAIQGDGAYDCTYVEYPNSKRYTFSYDCPAAGESLENADRLLRFRYWEDAKNSRAHYKKVLNTARKDDFVVDGKVVGVVYRTSAPEEYGRFVVAILLLDGHMCMSIESGSQSGLEDMINEARFRAADELRGFSGGAPAEGTWSR